MSWIITHSGRRVDLAQPDPSVIDLDDIVHALSNLCRFNGHTTRFVSVAEHSVRVARSVPERLARAALLHDAAEAYLGDMSKPLKTLFPEFVALEWRWQEAVAKAFGVPAEDMKHPAIKEADRRDLMSTRRDLGRANWSAHVWPEDEDGIKPLRAETSALSPTAARIVYMTEWRRHP